MKARFAAAGLLLLFVLAGSRKAGFRMIVYVDKGEDSNWYFDLTRPGQAALDVVPWQTPPWKR